MNSFSDHHLLAAFLAFFSAGADTNSKANLQRLAQQCSVMTPLNNVRGNSKRSYYLQSSPFLQFVTLRRFSTFRGVFRVEQASLIAPDILTERLDQRPVIKVNGPDHGSTLSQSQSEKASQGMGTYPPRQCSCAKSTFMPSVFVSSNDTH